MNLKSISLLLLPTVFMLVMVACGDTPQPTLTPAPPTPTPTPIPTQVPRPTPTQTSILAPAPLQRMRVQEVFPNVSFDRMVYLTHPDGVIDRLFLVLQPGFVMFFENTSNPEGVVTFLDIHNKVNDRGNEEGLLGLAFDPDYRDNGHFYVYYSASNPRRSVLSRFTVSSDPNRADTASEKVIMEIGQPFSNHNGGQIAFGPEGYLYIGLGDGGSGGDPRRNGQNLGTLLGTILRIDVSTLDATGTYSVPPDNPFVGVSGARPEIWAYGLRNPWRFSFDRETGDLWVGDVGQDQFEEIDLVTRGGNYGWNVMEASSCYQRRTCDLDGLELPVVDYGRSGGCSVTGGYVYRGTRLASLIGTYVYGDFCSGKIWALRYDGGRVTENMLIADTNLGISSFAEGPDGEVYILSFTGNVFRFQPE